MKFSQKSDFYDLSIKKKISFYGFYSIHMCRDQILQLDY